MSKDERLQEILRAFVDSLSGFVEGQLSPETHAATLRGLLAEVRELKGDGHLSATQTAVPLSA